MAMPMKSITISVEEYLRTEEESPVRREFVDGQVYDMTGATWSHNIINGNLFAALHSHLRSGPCQATISDMKVWVESANCFYYPDVMVTCEPFVADSVFNVAPVLIAEILSPSTSKTDRREKLIAYKQIPSLKEYMIVYQNRRRVELYQKNADGQVVATEYAAGQSVTLQSMPEPLTLSVESLYERVKKDWRFLEQG
jgi:Uma2 family endonuclease